VTIACTISSGDGAAAVATGASGMRAQLDCMMETMLFMKEQLGHVEGTGLGNRRRVEDLASASMATTLSGFTGL
jgi:hypothetical protein